LVEEAGEEMRVVDCNRELDQDVLVTEVGFLEAATSCQYESVRISRTPSLTSQY
jgi:hypothetical protein